MPFSALPAARAKAFRKVGNIPKRCGISRWISVIDYPSMLFCKGCCKPPFDCYSAVKRLLERLPRLTQRLPRLTSLAAFTNDEGKTSWPIQLLMLTSALPAAFALTLAPRAFSSSATRTLRSRTRTPALPAVLARRLAPPAPSPRSSRTSFSGTSGRRVAAPGAQVGYLGRCPASICATGSLRAWRRWGGPTGPPLFWLACNGLAGVYRTDCFPARGRRRMSATPFRGFESPSAFLSTRMECASEMPESRGHEICDLSYLRGA